MNRTIFDIATVAENYRKKMVQFLKENESKIYKLEKVPNSDDEMSKDMFWNKYLFDIVYNGSDRYFYEWVDFTRGHGENNVHSLTLRFSFEIAKKSICIYFFTSETFDDINKKIKERIDSAIKEEKEFIEEAQKMVNFCYLKELNMI